MQCHRQYRSPSLLDQQPDSRTKLGEKPLRGTCAFGEHNHMEAAVQSLAGMSKAALKSPLSRQRKHIEKLREQQTYDRSEWGKPSHFPIAGVAKLLKHLGGHRRRSVV